MAAMSNFLENKLIDWFFRGQAIGVTGASAAAGTGPTALFFSLFTTAPDAELGTGGVEVAAAGYARVSIACNTTNFDNTNNLNTTAVSTGVNGTTRNSIAITFGAPTAVWGAITSFGIYDALTGGNLLFSGVLGTGKTVNNGDAAPSFAINAFTLQVDN